ncbi:MAG TPA: TolC family protein, partial [Longimicrobiales bacterium]|nr:TolC family protein [Longimicrobiales bacterium]
TEAYYNAVLSDRLFTIADATMVQTETTLSQVKVAYQVGEQPEFELLRAQVARDNQRPVVIQRRADRDLAYIRLKQLLNLPLDEALQLTTGLGLTEPTALPVSATMSDTAVAQRAPVRQAAEGALVQEALVKVARAQRFPNVNLSSQYGRVAYPGGLTPSLNQFRTNWTVTASVEVPIFTGGRIRGDEMIAEANAQAARARLQETRELAALDTRDAIEALRAAESSWIASGGTVEQAVRAHTIAEVRYREGISTQLELDDARILLQQAQANRAIAARDLQVARVRLALLPDLPLGGVLGIEAENQAAVRAAIQPQQQLVPRITRTPQQSRPGVPVQASRVRN